MKEYDYELKKDYISSDLSLCKKLNELIDNNQIILLVSPQGTGKSEYFKGLDYKKIFISPTVATAQQVEQDNFNEVRGRFESTFSINGVDRFGNIIEQNYSSTFSSSKGIVNTNSVFEFDMLIVDEVHKLVQYSNFAYDQVTSIIKTINEFIRQDKKVILTTATPRLLSCVEQETFYKEIDVSVVIKCDRKYISNVYVVNNLNRQDTIIEFIKQNLGNGDFQIALINNKNKIKDIANGLNNDGIKALSVTGDEYRENVEKNDLVNQFKNADYHDYKVLLVTSWIDVGLNFKGKNIAALYCVFDNEYSNGDFTIIQQFVARTRNSLPKLYINKPKLSKDEQCLIQKYNIKSEYDKLLNDIKSVADIIIEQYSNGIIKNINPNSYYGIVKNKYSHHIRSKEYKFNYITAKYQLSKLIDKIDYNNGRVFELLLNIETIEEITDDIAINEYLERIDEYLQELYNLHTPITRDLFGDKIDELSNGRLQGRQPNEFLQRYFADKWKLDSTTTRDENRQQHRVHYIQKV